jgi:hypothetical protein
MLIIHSFTINDIYTHIHTDSNTKQTKQQNYIVTVYFNEKVGRRRRRSSSRSIDQDVPSLVQYKIICIAYRYKYLIHFKIFSFCGYTLLSAILPLLEIFFN